MEVLILLISIFANLYLLYYLSKRQELRRKYQYWAIVIILISSMIWSGTNICFYVFDPSNLYWIAIISYISGLFINLGSFSFLFTYNDNPIRKRQKIIIFLSYVFVFLVSIWTIIPRNVLLKIDVDQNNHWKLITARGIIVYGAFIAIASVLNVILAIFKYFSLSKQERIKFIGILVTVTLSSIGGFIFNMYLPLLGNYKFTWLGPSFVIIWVLYMVYAIIKYSIFNIKLVIGRSVYILVTSLFLLFFYLGVYKFQVFLWSDLLSKNAIILGFFISVIFVILFDRLTSYFNEFVGNTIIYNKGNNPYKIMKNFVEKIALEMDVGSLMKITIHTLYHLFKPNFVSIIIMDKQENLSIEGEKIFLI